MNKDNYSVKIIEFTVDADAKKITEQIRSFKKHHVLLIYNEFQVPDGFIDKAIALFESDPMIAFVNPRIVRNQDCAVNTIQIFKTYPIKFEYVPIAEVACVLIRDKVIFDFSIDFYSDFCLQRYLGASALCNRYGYRAVVYNEFTLVIKNNNIFCETEVLTQYPEVQWAVDDYNSNFEFKFANLFTAAYLAQIRSVLIDIRDMPTKMNGTSIIVLEFLNAIKSVQDKSDSKVKYTILLKPSQLVFLQKHGVIISQFEVVTSVVNRFFSIALKLGQPWLFSTLRELSECALYNFYYFYDTIATDCYYLRQSGQHLNEVWSFISQYADGIFFISQFSQQQFVNRYGDFCYKKTFLLPLKSPYQEINLVSKTKRNVEESYLLIVGNSLCHKAVRDTAILLAENKSHFVGVTKIILIGVLYEDLERGIVGYESGYLSVNELARLYTNASCVIFPSHYEGFGLPIADAMVYGKDIFVRSLPVYNEIQDAYQIVKGKLNIYAHNTDLIEKLTSFCQNNLDTACLPINNEAMLTISLESWSNTASAIIDEMLRLFESNDLKMAIHRNRQLDFQQKFWLESQELNKISVKTLLNKKVRRFIKDLL